MKKINKPRLLVKIFGAFGYLTLVTAFVLLFAVAVAILIHSGVIKPADATSSVNQHTNSAAANHPSAVVAIFGYVIAVVMSILSLAVVVTLPYFVGKVGAKVMRSFMKLFRVAVSRRSLLLTQIIVVTLPTLSFSIIQLVVHPNSVTFSVMHLLTAFLAIVSIGSFIVQVALARRFRLPVTAMW